MAGYLGTLLGSLLCYLLVVGHAADVPLQVFPWSDLSNVALWLSNAAYCPTNYLAHNFTGPTEGFIAVANLEHEATDTHGYVGYFPDQKSIYVVFRGSTSTTNWITNLDSLTTPYPSCENCAVHEGFSFAFSQVRDSMYSFVKDLLQKFPTYKLIVAGHSLGGALATLAAADMALSEKWENVQLVTFGSPRVGNEAFATIVSNSLPNTVRVTHYRDPAPHVPYHKYFTHVAGEWYEDDVGMVHECSGMEDPQCSYQWYYTQISDHMIYLGLKIGCKYVSTVEEQAMLKAMHFVELEDKLKTVGLM